MVGEPKRQAHDRQRRRRLAPGREHRTPGDEQIRHAVNATVDINYAFTRVVAHARGTHGMRRIGIGRITRRIGRQRAFERSEASRCEPCVQELV